jgi:mRNA interferase MazF
MKKGDLVLLSFPFTDLKGNKIRPALVLVVSDLDVIVAFITSQFKWQNQFDIIISPSKSNGLKKESLLRLSKITTIDKELVLGKLGELSDVDQKIINNKLSELLKL